MADKYIIEVEVDAASAAQTLTNLRNSVAGLNDTANNPSLDKLDRDLGKLGKTGTTTAQSLSSTRYALYDVSNTLGVMGAALVGVTGAIYGAGIAWERDFANVVRTSGVFRDGPQAIEGLRDAFIDLQQTLPVSSSDLARIGALAGQLGIEGTANIKSFTQAVAQISATSDLSVDAAATAFGRLNALLPDVNGQFDSLGSSILKVGVNSVATETQITNTATQISSMGAFAGLTADEVIGLSGALASVGVQPELARGTVTRLFTLMSRAVAEGGDSLEEFARISGVSADEFSRSFGTNRFGPIFSQFIDNLDNVNVTGGNTVKTLNELGITSVRDVPALTRLATAANSAGVAGQLLNQTLADAKDGFTSATELADQYAVINDTVAAKLQILLNNFNAFIVALADGGTQFSGIIDGAINLLQVLTDLADAPFIGDFLQFGVVLTGIVGVLLLVTAGFTRAAAGAIAFRQGLVGLNEQGAITTATMTRLSAAMKGVGIAALVAISFEGFKFVQGAINDARNEILGLGDDTEEVIDRLSNGGGFTKVKLGDIKDGGVLSFFADLNRTLSDFGIPADQFTEDLKTIDNRIADLVNSGNITAANELIAKLAKESGTTSSQVIESLRSTSEAFANLDPEVQKTAAAEQALTDAADAAAEAHALLAGQLGLSESALTGLQTSLAAAFSGFIDLQGILSDTTKDGITDINAFNDALEANIQAQISYSANVGTLLANGLTGPALEELAKLGPEGATLVKAAVDDMGGEGARLIELLNQQGSDAATGLADGFIGNAGLIADAFSQKGSEAATALKDALVQDAGQIGPAVQAVIDQYGLKITPTVDTALATAQLNTFVRNSNGKRIQVYVDPAGGRPINAGQYASGGYISGPGSGTSDSVPAWLSNGEFVLKASAVKKYGAGYLHALNQGRAQKFASGGQVGVSMPSSMVTSWGPAERALVRSIAQQTTQAVLQLDGQTIASNQAGVNKRNQAQGRG